jgi:AAA domain/DnaB-like helicase N terminal domain
MSDEAQAGLEAPAPSAGDGDSEAPPLDVELPLEAYADEPAVADAMNGGGETMPVTPSAPMRRVQAGTATASVAAEQAVIGSLLLEAPWADVAAIVRAGDYTPVHGLILTAIAAVASDGKPTDPIAVAAQLERTDHLAAAGGLEYLQQLRRDTPTAVNVTTYARAVRERAILARFPASHREADGIEQLRCDLAELDALQTPPAPSIALRHVAEVIAEHREAQWLGGLHKILERYVQAVLAGSRNTFKSFIADHWAMTAAINGESVVILSAEGAGLGRRIEAWMKIHAPAGDVKSLSLFALERAVNLNAPEVLKDLRQAIDAANITPALVVVDTLSKFSPGLDENDNAEVASFLSALSTALREHFGCTVLLVVHAGHGDAKRPRGASALMANPDVEYIVERPDPTAMTATVSRERFKDSPPMPPLAYTAEAVDLGRQDAYGEPVTSLVLLDADAATVAPARRPQLAGKAQRQLLGALRAQAPEGAGIWTLADMREVARKAGLHKNTARAAADALASSPFMVATVGGWRLADE